MPPRKPLRTEIKIPYGHVPVVHGGSKLFTIVCKNCGLAINAKMISLTELEYNCSCGFHEILDFKGD
jgi:hypothetical protein